MNLRKHLPSPAMIVALVALVAAIGGSAYAAATIGSKDVKNDSLRSVDVKDGKLKGKDLKADTLNGMQINEDQLGKVPSAAQADQATTANSAQNAQNAQNANSADDADTVDGQSPNDLKVRWLLLNEDGEIEEQSGGFTVVNAYDSNSNAYIDAGESLVGKGLTATIAIQNQVDTTGDMAADPNFAGEVSVTRCEIPGVVGCVPTGTNNVNTLVVSPRNSDGTPAAVSGSGEASKRVYVQVTE